MIKIAFWISLWLHLSIFLCVIWYDMFVAWTMDMWWGLFSKISQIIGQFGQIGRINCGIFGLKSQHTFCHCVSRVHDFPFINHYFYEKLSFWDISKKSLFGFGIWIWAANSYGFSHRLSVVRDMLQRKIDSYHSWLSISKQMYVCDT